MPHIHEKVDFVADTYIVHEGKVLLRHHGLYHMWLPVGGHIELDEDPNEAALREAKEESGLDVELVGSAQKVPGAVANCKVLIPPRFLNIHDTGPTHRHIGMIWFGRAKNAELNPTGDDADVELRWFSKEDLENNEAGVPEPVRTYALTALAEVK